MSGIARTNLDSAGGLIRPLGNTSFYVNNQLVGVVGDNVDDHAHHSNVKMGTGSSDLFACNLPVCRAGDQATCLDIVQSGSVDCFAD